MNISISTLHRQRLEEIKRGLQNIGCKESQFLKIELLFYEVLDISKTYGNDPNENRLLAALKGVQNDQYEKTKIATKKAHQRELSIRKFVISLRKALSAHQSSHN
jgi:hypothetical protein